MKCVILCAKKGLGWWIARNRCQQWKKLGTTLGAGTKKVPGFTPRFCTQWPHFSPPERKIFTVMPSACPGSWRESRGCWYFRTRSLNKHESAHVRAPYRDKLWLPCLILWAQQSLDSEKFPWKGCSVALAQNEIRCEDHLGSSFTREDLLASIPATSQGCFAFPVECSHCLLRKCSLEPRHSYGN